MILAWDGGEAGWSILRTDLQGRKQWGIKPGAVFVASDGKERIFASGGFGFHDGNGVESFSLKDGRPMNFGNGKPKINQPPGGDRKSNAVTGLAWADGKLLVAYAHRNLLCVYGADSGASQYATFVSMDPKRDDEVFCHMTAWKVDLDRGTWEPLSTMWRATKPNMVAGAYERVRVITAKNGRHFAWGRHNYANVLYLRQGDVFKPLVAAIIVAKGNQYVHWPPYPVFRDSAKYPNAVYLWQDTNDDQIIEEDEVSKAPFGRGEDFADWVDDELNLYGADGLVFRPARFAAAGWRATLNKPTPKAGQVWGITAPLGVAGEITGVASYFSSFHLFTRDGICVAKLFKDQRLGETGPDVINAEAFAGQLVKLEKSGRYVLLAGDTDGRVTEVTGLDTIRRFEGIDDIPSESRLEPNQWGAAFVE